MKKSVLLIIALLALTFWMLPATSAQGPCAGATHVVKTGENMYRIGLAYGYTADQLAAANGLVNVNQVYIGQVLCIPGTLTSGNVNTGVGGNLNQAPTTTTTTAAPSGTFPDTNTQSSVVSGPVSVNSGDFILERAADSVVLTIPAGTLDIISGYTTTATVALDATNNNLGITTIGMIPNSQVRVYVSTALGDLSGGYAGVLMADNNGVVSGFVEIPFIAWGPRQYVMIRAYDGRMTWGYFDLGQRFP